MSKKIFKNDKYKKARGGYSRMLDIFCLKCETKILQYQKDGPGSLKRMYIDRILSPNYLSKLSKNNLKDLNVLKCPNCKSLIAYPYIYKKEARKSFRVFQDAIVKKIKKIN